MTNAQLQTRPLFSESMHNDLFTVSGQQSSTGQTAPDFGNCHRVFNDVEAF